MRPAEVIGVVVAINWLTIPLAGFLVFLATWSWPYAWRRPMVICRASALLMRIAEFFTRFENGIRAFTWGPWMFTFRADLADRTPKKPLGFVAWQDNKLVKHESHHAFCALYFGLLFFVMYGIASLVAVLRGRHWYQDNWFEIEATKAETA